MKLRLANQSYEVRSKAIVGSRLVNMYAEANPEGAKYPYTLYPTPGFKPWADTGSLTDIQGAQVMGSLLYVVSGNTVYKVTTAGAVSTVGTITGTQGRVDLANNGTELVIVNPDGDAWEVTSSSVTAISDADFPTASSVTYLDGYHIVSKTSTGQFYISSSLDPTNWDALDFATAEEAPDNLVRVTSFNSALWLFGETSYEVYYNSGNADFPFTQIQGASNTTRGCAAKFSVAQDDSSLFFLGDDKIVYKMVGYNPVRISTYAEEHAIEGFTTISDAFADIYTQGGHKFYVLTFPDAGRTFVYDISNGKWHERDNFNGTQYTAAAIVKFANKVLVCHNGNGQIYELDYDTYDEDGTTIQRIIEGSVTWADGARVIHDRVRLDVKAGVGLTTGQGSDPQIMMSYSDDGKESFSNERWVGFGKIGERKTRAIWRRCGISRERIYRFKVTDPVEFIVLGAYIDARIGKS